MATRTSAVLWPYNGTDADFRAWVQFIEDTFVTTGGWVVTSDTGQMTIGTATKPVGANTKVGYRIYRMNDTLSGSYPCYLKIYYGSGAAVNNPGCWIVLGTGSDGSGNITGVLYSDQNTTSATFKTSSSSNTTANNCYGSATTGRCTLGMFVNGSNAAFTMAFGIERTVDTSGTPDSTGFILAYNAAGNPLSRSHYLVAADGSLQVPVETGCAHIISSQNPSSFGGNVGIGLMIPIRGVSQRPGYNWAAVKSSDFTAETTFTMTLYSTSVTYLQMNLLEMQQPGAGSVSTTRACMRYD